MKIKDLIDLLTSYPDDMEVVLFRPACEYAEEATKADASDPNLSATDLNGIKHDVAEYAEEVIRFPLRRYCLVEKSKLEEAYKSSKHYFEHTDSSNPTQKQYFWGRMCAIESLFPEIAKEVEG